MSAEITNNYLETIYRLIELGQLNECDTFMRELVEEFTRTKDNKNQLDFSFELDTAETSNINIHTTPHLTAPFTDLTFAPLLSKIYEWLVIATDGYTLNSKTALSLDLGSFDVNYENLSISALYCPTFKSYNNRDELYNWLAETDRHFLSDDFELKGFSALKNILRRQDKWNCSDSPKPPPIDQELFTACCYLVFTQFLKAIRLLHQQAAKNNHPIASTHLFAYYGDLIYHSLPTAPSN